jgi:hypothetical protein
MVSSGRRAATSGLACHSSVDGWLSCPVNRVSFLPLSATGPSPYRVPTERGAPSHPPQNKNLSPAQALTADVWRDTNNKERKFT